MRLLLFERLLQCIADETTHMIVGKLLEFLRCEHVGEESENLCVGDLDVVWALLLRLIIQA